MLTDSQLGGRYRVIRHLGGGAMGEVWLVEHILLGRREALKILEPRTADTPELLARFRREARALNRLQHPSIVAVHDFGQLPDGRFYLSMEYVEGNSLGAVLRKRGALPLPQALRVLAQLADAIDHAHERGVLHRDLKPDNLVVVQRRGGADGLKVLDFGLAKIVGPGHDDGVASMHGGAVYGTAAYVAPEQLDGVTDDHRIDLYSFGCIAFELVTGRPPFVGKLMSVLDAHAGATPPRPSEVAAKAGIPVELDALIMACLAKRPDDRPRRARDLVARIRQTPGYVADHDSGRRTQRGVDAGAVQQGFAYEDTHLGHGAVAGTDAEAAAAEYHAAIRALGEALLDAGSNDIHLILGVAELAKLSSQLDAATGELAELDRSAEHVERTGREREAALRFALGDLRFERKGLGGPAADREIDQRLAELEAQLREVARDRSDTIARISDREVDLVAAIATHEEELERVCVGLEPALLEQVARFARTDALDAVAARARQCIDAARRRRGGR